MHVLKQSCHYCFVVMLGLTVDLQLIGCCRQLLHKEIVEEFTHKLPFVIHLREVGNDLGNNPVVDKRQAACIAVVFDTGTARAGFEFLSVITMTNGSAVDVFRSSPSMCIGTNRRAPLTNNCWRCR